MVRGLLAALVALCIWSGGSAWAQGVEDLQAGLEHLRAGRHEQACERFDAALKSERLSAGQRGAGHMLRGICHRVLGNKKAARADYDQAVELMDDPSPALNLRSSLAYAMDDREQALKDVMRLAREFPPELADVNLSLLWGLWRWLRDEGRTDDQFALVESVVKAGYQPSEAGRRPDGLVQEYIGALIDRKRAEEALPLTEKIVSTRILLEMRVSGRFRPLWKKSLFNEHTAPLAAAERELAHWKGEVANHPKGLGVILRHMQVLRMLGESAVVIGIGEKVLKNPGNYDDDRENRLWVRNELAYAYMEAGRQKDAVALMQPLLERSAKDEPWLVSQFINFGIMLLNMDKPERALAAVDKAKGRVSPYGRKWIDSTQACAFHRLGKSAEAAAAIKRLKTKPEENYAALSRAYLCLDRVDDAVQLALTRLRDPDHRDAMLMNLQSYKEHEGALPLVRKLKSRWKRVSRDPRIQAEAKKHGRLLEIPLYQTYWGDV